MFHTIHIKTMIKYLYNKTGVIIMSKCVMCGNEFDSHYLMEFYDFEKYLRRK